MTYPLLLFGALGYLYLPAAIPIIVVYIDVYLLSCSRIVAVVPHLINSRPAINRYSKDTLSVFQVVKAWVDKPVTIELARSFYFGQALRLWK